MVKKIQKTKTANAINDQGGQFRLIADARSQLVACIDKDFRYRYCNKAYEEWLEVSVNKIRGKHVSEVLGKKAYESQRGWI